MEHKSFGIAELKTLGNADAPGSFEAIVSVFGNVDLGGDRVKKGAFTRTLAEKGLPPIVWSHNWDIPPIGVVTEAAENNEGLRVKGRLFVAEDEDHAIARQVYAAMKAQDGNGKAPLREFSFGYSVVESSEETKDEQTVRVLEDVDLYEVGPTLSGMNPETRLVGVKALHEYADQLEQLDAAEETQPEDKPAPKELSEEEQARIARLVAAHPNH